MADTVAVFFGWGGGELGISAPFETLLTSRDPNGSQRITNWS